jgi:hypothetical protein
MDPRQRLTAFLAWIGWSNAKLAERIGLDPGHIYRIRKGEKPANLVLAAGVERLTREFHWPDGPIEAASWAEPATTSTPDEAA